MLSFHYFVLFCYILSSFTWSQQTMPPGFQFLGKGYDTFQGNPYDTSGSGDPGWREQIFKFTTAENQRTPDNMYIVPDKTQATLLSSCSLEQTETLINDGYDYQHTVSFGFGVDLSLFGAAFQFSIDSKHVTHTTKSQESIYAQLESTCAVYQLAMNYYLSPPVSDEFFYGALSLTDNYDEDAYMTFLQVFGTHYVRTLRLGGRWGWLIEFSRTSFQKLMDDRVDWNLGLKYAGKVQAGLNLNGSDDTSLTTTVMNAVYHNFSYNIGGDYHPDAGEWMASVRATPMPIQMDPLPVYELLNARFLPNVTNLMVKQAFLKNATLNYCNWLRAHVDSTVNCTKPEPLPHVVPSPVPDDVARGICIENSGGYAMYWRLYNEGKSGVYAESDTFPAGQKRCLDGLQVQAQNGDRLSCGAMILAGKQDFPACGDGVLFDGRTTLMANYKCGGSTMGPSCSFEGFSE